MSCSCRDRSGIDPSRELSETLAWRRSWNRMDDIATFSRNDVNRSVIFDGCIGRAPFALSLSKKGSATSGDSACFDRLTCQTRWRSSSAMVRVSIAKSGRDWSWYFSP